MEGGLGRVLLRLERGGRGDHLERGPGDVEPGARPVQERGGRLAVRRDLGDASEVLLDEVRVEARRGRHDPDLPGPGVERDDCPAARPELALRATCWASRSSVVRTSFPSIGLPRSSSSALSTTVERFCVRRRQVVVQRALEPGPRAPDRRVADDVRGQRALRVAAEEERLRADLALDVPREPPPRLEREDEPAVDRELRDAPDRVVLPGREAGGRPRLPVRRHHDEQSDERERDVREPDDLPVHRGCVGAVGDEQEQREEEEVRRRRSSRRTRRTGSVIPVSGTTRRTPPTMMNVCRAKPKVRPAARSFEKPSCATAARPACRARRRP